MPARSFAVLCLLLATTPGAAAQDVRMPEGAAAQDVGTPADAERDDAGRTAFDRKVEAALREGDVVAREPIPVGITHPDLLTLRMGDVQIRAIFKTIDAETRGLSRCNVVETHFTDRYAYEAAAYRLDRLFRIDLVPPTILREIDGKRGSVQYWIEDATTIGQAIVDGRATKSVERFRRNKISMNVLDALIHNIDRRPLNILVTFGDDGFFLVDHSRAFRDEKTLPPFLLDWDGELEARVAARLRGATDEEIRAALAGLVTDRQIKAVAARRKLLLRKLAELKLLPAD